MNLEDIGFYTLTDERAERASIDSPLQRCELILTPRCNFACPYCRGCSAPELPYEDAEETVKLWLNDELQNIRFSGGEPTLWPELERIVKFAETGGVKRIAVSTNGSADPRVYDRLIDAGVNDFSVSLDACCASTGDRMAGEIGGAWERVTRNIERMSKRSYVTVGIVVTPENISELFNTIELAANLGVSDIRLISSAQWDDDTALAKELEHKSIPVGMPILKYRVDNLMEGRRVRGITGKDNLRCPLVVDDMAVMGGHHYPCIIYLREGGDPIGKVGPFMRKKRLNWFRNHNTFMDDICRKNCLDVCVDYNNAVRYLNKELGRSEG